MNDKETRPAGTKSLLLSAAEELFTQKGYAAVSTREIAERAGVNLAAINYHFGSKANLFISTIHHMLSRQWDSGPLFAFESKATNRFEAAVELCFVVVGLLREICAPEGPELCRVMHREILGQTAHDENFYEMLVSSVVDEFFKPVDEHLLSLIRILDPKLSDEEAVLSLQSIYGQCTYYSTDRAYIERLRGKDYVEEPMFSIVAKHITTFTLRGFGFSSEEIGEIVNKAKDFSEKGEL